METEIEVVWKDGKPQCPCGGHNFSVTYQLLDNGIYLLEYLYCISCFIDIKITPALEKWIRREGLVE